MFYHSKFQNINFHVFRKPKSYHVSSSNKIKYNDENKAIMSSATMQNDKSINRKNDRDDNLPDKAQGKASQQKQSSHSNNSSSRGNSVLLNVRLHKVQ